MKTRIKIKAQDLIIGEIYFLDSPLNIDCKGKLMFANKENDTIAFETIGDSSYVKAKNGKHAGLVCFPYKQLYFYKFK